jgi:predicted RNA methylase
MLTSRNHAIADALRQQQPVTDADFDRVYTGVIQSMSARYWTPVDVALRAADWLRRENCRSVFDVGAGAGKFCIIARLASGCDVQGIEQRSPLVEAARSAAANYGADVTFELGTIEAVDPGRFNAFYFYNPFGENHYTPSERFDDSVELSATRCTRELSLVEAWLDTAARGTCVLTYHGFGGRIPDTYRLVQSETQGSDVLRLWTKRSAGRASGFFLELGELVMASAQLEKLWNRLAPKHRVRLRALLDRPLG